MTAQKPLRRVAAPTRAGFVFRFGVLLGLRLIFALLFIHFPPFCMAKVPKIPRESNC